MPRGRTKKRTQPLYIPTEEEFRQEIPVLAKIMFGQGTKEDIDGLRARYDEKIKTAVLRPDGYLEAPLKGAAR